LEEIVEWGEAAAYVAVDLAWDALRR